MTERLYWNDAYQREFTARVIRRTAQGLVLDRTLFYPTSGGQPHDTGTLNGARVVDVLEEGEDIVHVVETPVSSDEVAGTIDWDRRVDHMQQHDGQHILSAAFERECGADTSSFHLGPEICTIDLASTNVSTAHVERAEKLANRVIWENRKIHIGFHSPDEVAGLPLRKAPAVAGPVRIVQVEDFDWSACCGTHARSSGETGVVRVFGLERRATDTRVSFACGWRALTHARADHSVVREAGSKLSAPREGILAALDRASAEAVSLRRAVADSGKELARYQARDLYEAAPLRGPCRFAVVLLQNGDLKHLQALATHLVEREGVVALLGCAGAAVLARSRTLNVDLRPVAAEVFASLGWRGGGPAHFVQGGGAGGDPATALKAAEQKIAALLGC